MMRFLICAVALLCGTVLMAGEPQSSSDTLFESFGTKECQCDALCVCKGECEGECHCETLASQEPPFEQFGDQRLRALEARVSELERTAVTSDEAERIAEMVVDRRIREIRIAINTADGGQRVERVNLDENQQDRSKTVQFADGSTVQLTLGPGEVFASVTDPVTGQVHTLGEPTRHVNVPGYSEPVPSWQTPYGEFRMQPRSVNQSRRIQWMPASGGSCASGTCGY